MQPNPFGQSAPDPHAAVQYPGPCKQPKLHIAASVQVLPTSLAVQNFSLLTVEHRIPEGQPPSTTQLRVHRDGPFFHIARQSKADAHSASPLHKSSTPFVPPPLLDELDELLDEALDELLEELLDAGSPLEDELDEELAIPPMPPMPPPLELLLAPSSSKHCPARHLNPGLQSRSESAHSRRQEPSTHAPSTQSLLISQGSGPAQPAGDIAKNAIAPKSKDADQKATEEERANRIAATLSQSPGLQAIEPRAKMLRF